MAFSWASPGRTEEAACNEAPYLVAEGRIRRVTRGQLGRNNESFLFLFVSVSNPLPLLLLPVRTVAHQVTFSFFGRGEAQHCRYLANRPHMLCCKLEKMMLFNL